MFHSVATDASRAATRSCFASAPRPALRRAASAFHVALFLHPAASPGLDVPRRLAAAAAVPTVCVAVP